MRLILISGHLSDNNNTFSVDDADNKYGISVGSFDP